MNSTDKDDTQLIRRIMDHDRDAFERFYRRYASRIMAFLTRYLGPSEGHEEVVNDVMIVIWERSSGFRPTSRPSTWLFGIARRKALEAYRRATKIDVQPPALLHNQHESEDLETTTLKKERLDIIRKALKRLPLDQRTALTLAFFIISGRGSAS